MYTKEAKDDGNKMQHEGKSSGQAQRDAPSLVQELHRRVLKRSKLESTDL
jgi:hypothetical protein